MSELRKDPVVGRWVIMAPEQATSFPPRTLPPAPSSSCPFCPGKEDWTPPEIVALRRDGSRANQPGWSLRVVPNLFAALRVEGKLDGHGDGLFEREAGVGAHEIVIETAEHGRDFADLSPEEMADVAWMWSERLRDLAGDLRLRAALVFRHRGSASGEAVGHAHSQILVSPVVPPALQQELDGAAAFFRTRERCPWCEIVGREREEGARLVLENRAAVAISPWAARVPFELCVLPRRHSAAFEEESRDALAQVMELLRRVLVRLDAALERPPCSIVLHTAPLRDSRLPLSVRSHFHWHLEILPQLGPQSLALGEWPVNPILPEEAAAALRRLHD